ncbi:MAG: HD domain-containing protein [bacterium]
MAPTSLKRKLSLIAKAQSRFADASHDFNHTQRVVQISEKIGIEERTDLEILIPAAMFHDSVVSRKNDPRARSDTIRSAKFAKKVLSGINNYPSNKIVKVSAAIRECSYTFGGNVGFLEGKIIQDADRLDAIGAIGIMRAFATTGQLQIPLFHDNDPFCRRRNPNQRRYGLDFIFTRMLRIETGMNTDTGKKIASQRTAYLRSFLDQIDIELKQSMAES